VSGPLLLPTWEQLAASHPELVATMGRYLEQISCVLRPGSVAGTDLALRSFAAFLIESAPEVTSTAQVTRRHVENYNLAVSCDPPRRLSIDPAASDRLPWAAMTRSQTWPVGRSRSPAGPTDGAVPVERCASGPLGSTMTIVHERSLRVTALVNVLVVPRGGLNREQREIQARPVETSWCEPSPAFWLFSFRPPPAQTAPATAALTELARVQAPRHGPQTRRTP
jgi:hypothetical protein